MAINSETVFNLSGSLRAGRNAVGCRIVGQGTTFDLDVYEIEHVDSVLGEGRGSRLALSRERPEHVRDRLAGPSPAAGP